MYDSHCHLADDAFVGDLEAVVARALTAGVTGALCILAADNEIELTRAHQLASLWREARFAVGIHPHQAGAFARGDVDVVAMVRSAIHALPATRAVGEIGLDYHYDFAPREVQQTVFRLQLRLARELNLPVVIHTREAEEDTLRILTEECAGAVRGVMHCFTGTRALADAAVALGMHVSFAGIVTFPKGANVREVAAGIPENRLLCETDSPYLAPTPYRGRRNEPAWVMRVAETLAEARGTTAERVRTRTTENFRELFRP